MIPLLSLLLGLLAGLARAAVITPGRITDVSLGDESVETFTFDAKDPLATLRFTLEGVSGAEPRAVACVNVSDFSSCKTSPTVTLYQNHPRTFYPDEEASKRLGTWSIFVYTTTARQGEAKLTVDNAITLLDGYSFTSTDSSTYVGTTRHFMYFLCDDQDLVIKKEGETQNAKLYASQRTGRPTKDDTIGSDTGSQMIISRSDLDYPKYVYFTLEGHSAGVPIKLSVNGDLTILSANSVTSGVVGPFEGCYRNYRVQNIQPDKPVAFASVQSLDSATTPLDLYLATAQKPAHMHNYEYLSSKGVLTLQDFIINKDEAYLAVATDFSMTYLPYFTPTSDSLSASFKVFYSQDCTAMTPTSSPVRKSLKIGAGGADAEFKAAIPFKNYREVFSSSSSNSQPVASDYAVTAYTAESSGTRVSLSMGVGSPNSFQVNGQAVSGDDKTLQAIISQESSDYAVSELYFAKVVASCVSSGCTSGSAEVDFVASHIYRLETRTPVTAYPGKEVSVSNLHFSYYIDDSADGVELEVSGKNLRDAVIYASQDAYLPNSRAYSWQEKVVSENKILLSISGSDGKLRSGERIYFTVATPVTVTVTAAPLGQNLIELLDGHPKRGVLAPALGEGSRVYMFNPRYIDAYNTEHEFPWTILALEIPGGSIGTTAHAVAYMSTEPDVGPSNHYYKLEPSSGSTVTDSETPGGKALRATLKLRTPPGKNIYLAIGCEGPNCATANTLNYAVTVFSAQEITGHQRITPRLRPSGQPLIFIYDLHDQTDARIKFHAKTMTAGCSKIGYKVITCIGTPPTVSLLLSANSVAQSTCSITTVNTAEGDDFSSPDASITVDSTRDNVAAGDLYISIYPILDAYEGTALNLLKCDFELDLWANTHVKEFFEPYVSYVQALSRPEANAYLTFDVPATSDEPATSSGVFGDRLILNFKADAPVTLCIGADPEYPHPSPTNMGSDNCNVYKSSGKVRSVSEVVYIPEEFFATDSATGNLQKHTPVYVSIDAEENAEADVVIYQQVKYEITLTPQAYLPVQQDKIDFRFCPSSLFGLAKKHTFAFSVPDSHASDSFTVVVQPTFITRDDIPLGFYSRQLLTYVSDTERVPDSVTMKYTSNVGGIQNIEIGRATNKIIYVTVEYRGGDFLTTECSKPFLIYLDMIPVEEVAFGSLATVDHFGAVTPEEFAADNRFAVDVAYDPSEIIIFPCRGDMELLVDSLTPTPGQQDDMSMPTDTPYQFRVSAAWGKPLSLYIARDNATAPSGVNYYVQVRDRLAASSTSQGLHYEVLVGSSDFRPIPGDNGRINIMEYSTGGNGKIVVRVAPAAAPTSSQAGVPIQYLLYALPYKETPDTASDYSPYTACGVLGGGYSIYYNEESKTDFIAVDPEQASADGYVELTSNLNLWREGTPDEVARGSPLLIVVLARGEGTSSYQGTIAKPPSKSHATGIAVGVSVAVIVVVLIAAGLGLYFGYFKNHKNKRYSRFDVDKTMERHNLISHKNMEVLF